MFFLVVMCIFFLTATHIKFAGFVVVHQKITGLLG
jgi:hypothetical protein